MDEDNYESTDPADDSLPNDLTMPESGSSDAPATSVDQSSPSFAVDNAFPNTDNDEGNENDETFGSLLARVANTVVTIAKSWMLGPAEQEQATTRQGKTGVETNRIGELIDETMEDVDDLDFAPTPYLAGPGCYVDGTGVYQRALPGTVKGERYGKTDEALEEGESVTVSLWSYDADEEEWVDSDEDQEDVYDSFWYQGLTLPSYGVFVKIRYNPENSRWEIVEVPRLEGTMAADLNENGYANATVFGYALKVYASYVQTSAINSGTKVIVGWNTQNKRWEVVGRAC